jgi:hypothetical protein
MKTKNILCGLAMAVVLQVGMLAGSAQTNKYLFTGSETNITLPPGTYIITAYGSAGGDGGIYGGGGLGAEMSAEFNFSSSTTLTLLLGGGYLAFQPLHALAIVLSGPNVILTWPTNITGTLQFTTNLVSPAIWNTNLPAPVVVNGQNASTNPISGSQMFFRLVQ